MNTKYHGQQELVKRQERLILSLEPPPVFLGGWYWKLEEGSAA
jgi:hypothetical protein